MIRTGDDTLNFPIDAGAARHAVAAVADNIVQTLRVARALVAGGRSICLDGLDAQVGQLCARTLGLNCEDAEGLRLHLLALRAELDATMLLLDPGRQAPCRSTTS